MSTKPTVTPTWNTSGTNNVTPSAGRKAAGFATGGDVPGSGEMNWILKANSDAGAYALEFGAEVNPGGRLTVTTGVPVSVTDTSGAATIYYSPIRGNRIVLFDGTNWSAYTFSEVSQTLADTTKSPAAAVASTNYDMFAWMDSSTFRCTRGFAWTTSTFGSGDRGTGAGTAELELYQGRIVNKYAITNGPAARKGLYVGTIRTDSSGATVSDGLTSGRNVWNLYNQVRRDMGTSLGTSTWTYNSATIRQRNGDAASQLSFVVGLDQQSVYAEVRANASNPTTNNVIGVGIGLNSTTAFDQLVGTQTRQPGRCFSSADTTQCSATWNGAPGAGAHYLAWLEFDSTATNTTTWKGKGTSSSATSSGMFGWIMA
jgi:hypothetical protein